MPPSYLNTYKPPVQEIPVGANKATPLEEYDFNFVFPVKELSTDRIKLVPFVPSLHGKLLADGLMNNPNLSEFLPFDVKNEETLFNWLETQRQNPLSDSQAFLFHAIYSAPPGPDADKVPVEDYVFAGGIGAINASYLDSTAELGWIIILPQFQRTHVLTHAAGALMHRILDSTSEGGLGLRRCQWFTNSLHVKSQAAALRLGFTLEGILRAHRVMPLGKKGVREGRKGEEREDQNSRDSWIASVSWEEWEQRVRQHVDALMARKQ